MYKTLALLLLVLLFLPGSCDSSNCPEDGMDKIRDFKPDDEYFKSALVSLHFRMETSPIPEVDASFKQLIKAFDLPVSAKGAKDGTYTGTTPYDAFDYRHEVTLKIKDGLIVEADYNELKKDGHGKEEDVDYCEEMSITGTTPAIAYPILEERLLSAQNMMDVDAVSGATYSLHRFRLAVTVALMQAYI